VARLSPITIGLAASMIAVVGAAVFVLARPRHGAAPADSAGAAPSLPPEPEPPQAPRVAALPPPAPGPAPAPAPTPPPRSAETPAAESDPRPAGEDAPAPGATKPNRRALLALNHNQRLDEADAQVFVSLNLPEATRAAVRRINDEYRRRTELGPERPGGPDAGETAAALKARQDALALLLGAGPAKDFDVEERSAVRRLRGKYRFEWGRLLRQ
jgi:hypothetical protein